MNLFETFLTLDLPIESKNNIFNAVTLQEFPFAKVAVNNIGFPVLLISSMYDGTHLSKRNIRLKYLELTHNLECKITENKTSNYSDFSVIIFKSDQQHLQKYFLGIAETFVKTLSKNPTQKEVDFSFNHLIEVFQSFSVTPTKTIQGIWSELLIINISKTPSILVEYWHNIPSEKFDFNANSEKIEVKSNSNLERTHIFSSEQLNPKEGSQVLIASIFTRQKTNGKSVEDLLLSIKEKITSNELIDKLFQIVSKTLGNTIDQSIKIKFDYDLAVNSIKYYRHQDISKIERIDIPDRVSEVRYKSDLSDIKPIEPDKLTIGGLLYEAI